MGSFDFSPRTTGNKAAEILFVCTWTLSIPRKEQFSWRAKLGEQDGCHILGQISLHILKAKQTEVILKSGLSYNWVDT